VLRDVRLEGPPRFFALRSIHAAPFVDGGWVWDRRQHLEDVSMRSRAGLRLIAGFGFGSLLRFEVIVDVAYPLDERGQQEDEGVQVWVR
jgi:hypothetical protein